jgi:hypothetical protein
VSELGAAVADGVARATTRKGFLARLARFLLVLTGGSAVAASLEAEEAQGFHFCGHIYTTDSCPHPTGLPRVDARGYPLRAADGKPVDNLGRRVDSRGFPLLRARSFASRPFANARTCRRTWTALGTAAAAERCGS